MVALDGGLSMVEVNSTRIASSEAGTMEEGHMVGPFGSQTMESERLGSSLSPLSCGVTVGTFLKPLSACISKIRII